MATRMHRPAYSHPHPDDWEDGIDGFILRHPGPVSFSDLNNSPQILQPIIFPHAAIPERHRAPYRLNRTIGVDSTSNAVGGSEQGTVRSRTRKPSLDTPSALPDKFAVMSVRDKPPKMDSPLRNDLRMLHRQIEHALSYYRDHIRDFESAMNNIKTYADNSVQDSIWKKRVADKAKDDFEVHGMGIERRMKVVRETHADLRYGDEFVKARAESLMKMLDQKASQISLLATLAKEQWLACQQLVDELDFARRLANPNSARVQSVFQGLAHGGGGSGRPLGDKAKGTGGDEDSSGGPGGADASGGDGGNSGDSGDLNGWKGYYGEQGGNTDGSEERW